VSTRASVSTPCVLREYPCVVLREYPCVLREYPSVSTLIMLLTAPVLDVQCMQPYTAGSAVRGFASIPMRVRSPIAALSPSPSPQHREQSVVSTTLMRAEPREYAARLACCKMQDSAAINATRYTEQFARHLASSQLTVVSGLASLIIAAKRIKTSRATGRPETIRASR
jgi:hypothetical protein